MSMNDTQDLMRALPALSIRQPWATSILNGKDIENREWRTKYRGRFLIHAAKTLEQDDIEAWRVFVGGFENQSALSWATSLKIGTLPLGGIIGVAELTDCVNAHPSPWFCGPWGFVIRDARPLDFVPCRGMPGFFSVKGAS